MHVHTCPSCERMVESSTSTTDTPCSDCIDSACFDEDAPTRIKISVIPLRQLAADAWPAAPDCE